MNADELRAAADEVARMLKIGYRYNLSSDPRWYSYDLLSEAGGGELQTAPLARGLAVNIKPGWRGATRGVIVVDITDVKRHEAQRPVVGKADTWPAALVLAAQAALRAGWLEGKC